MTTIEQATPMATNGTTAPLTAGTAPEPSGEPTQTQSPTTTSTPSQNPSKLDPANFPQHLSSPDVYIELRYTPLDTTAALQFTRSPSCGANVLFLGTTRNNFDNRPVTRLSYSAYPALALKSLFAIAEDVRVKHGLEKVYIAHRLGEVGVEEESIAVSVSSGHRGAGWRGAEEVLERVKKWAEIWKREWFADTGEGDWRANRDRDGEGRVVQKVSLRSEGGASDGERDPGKDVLLEETGDVGGAEAVETSRTEQTSITAGPEEVTALADSESKEAGVSAMLQDRGALQPTAQARGDDLKQRSAAVPSRVTTTHQTSKELDSDVADYIAAMTAKLKM